MSVKYMIRVLMLAASTYLEVNSKNIQLKITDGSILGKSGSTQRLNKTYYAFQGIPYAEPPKRFEEAVPKTPWTGVLNCTYDKDECVQGLSPVTGSEDCLFLSVYTVNITRKSAVLVWIHGGAFITGNASYESAIPDYFLDEDLVVVQIQYRIGVFGFLSTGNEAAPGNFGLKDQLLALKWVQKNIKHFGGDPKNVTIFGESAGSVSVSLHLTSKKSKGLFKGAIMDSGVSLCLWSLTRHGDKSAQALAGLYGIRPPATAQQVVDKFKSVDYKDLQQKAMEVTIKILGENPLAGLAFGPVREYLHNSSFLDVKTDEAYLKGDFTKVPILVGFNSNEGVQITPTLALVIGKNLEAHVDRLVPADIMTSKNNLTVAGKKIKSEFWGDRPIALATDQSIQFITIDQFVRPISSYIGKYRDVSGDDYIGVAHIEELRYLFSSDDPYEKEDQNMRLKMVRMWSNFCKFSKPIPQPDSLLGNAKWLSANSTKDPYLFNIDKEMGPIKNPHQIKLNFYEREIYGIYGQGVYDTY